MLSMGQRRRLLLARAFYRRPALIVLDEPAAHLDRPGRDQLIEAITELKDGGSRIVVASQSNRLGRIADKTYMLRRSSRRKRNSSANGTATVTPLTASPTANGPS